jgi:hypothetical protein
MLKMLLIKAEINELYPIISAKFYNKIIVLFKGKTKFQGPNTR